jgi:adenine-specific DNA-methyltransferase
VPRQSKINSKARSSSSAKAKAEADYRHPAAETPLRPEVGTQSQFRKRKLPATYRYDSSLSPALEWDGRRSPIEHYSGDQGL